MTHDAPLCARIGRTNHSKCPRVPARQKPTSLSLRYCDTVVADRGDSPSEGHFGPAQPISGPFRGHRAAMA